MCSAYDKSEFLCKLSSEMNICTLVECKSFCHHKLSLCFILAIEEQKKQRLWDLFCGDKCCIAIFNCEGYAFTPMNYEIQMH